MPLSPRPRNERLTMRNFDELITRDESLAVICTHCGARAGEVCTTKDRYGNSHPLQNFPAHPARNQRAERQKRLRQLDAEREAQ